MTKVFRCRQEIDQDGGAVQRHGWYVVLSEHSATVCPFKSEPDRDGFVGHVTAAGGDERAAAFAALSHWDEGESQQERGWWLLHDNYPETHERISEVLDRYQGYEARLDVLSAPEGQAAHLGEPLARGVIDECLERGPDRERKAVVRDVLARLPGPPGFNGAERKR